MVGIYGIFENLFRFWRFRCSGNYLLLKKITTLILICKVTVKSSCLSYWFCISFISFYSSSVKRLRDSNLLWSLLSFFKFCNFFWRYEFFNLITAITIFILEIFIITFWVFIDKLNDSAFSVEFIVKNWTRSIRLLINTLFSLFDKISFSSDFFMRYIFDLLKKTLVLSFLLVNHR